MYFEAHVVATEFRRKMLATAASHFSGFFSLLPRTKKIAMKRQLKGSLTR
jgi:hypothetical protein